MATLAERIDWQLAALAAEKQRLTTKTQLDLATVDAQIAALTEAKTALTATEEASYAKLKAMGLVNDNIVWSM